MCSSMGALGLSEPETGLLCGAVLLSPDRSGLVDVKAVRSYQDKVLDALRLQVRGRRGCTRCTRFTPVRAVLTLWLCRLCP